MRKGIRIISVLILLTLIGVYVNKQNKMPTSDIIEQAVIDYINHGQIADFLTEKNISKLKYFKEKFQEEGFTHYRTEAFQAREDSTVYLMLIVEPTEPEERGIVLYMTFKLKSEFPIEITQLIISNWVVIEYEAKQF